MLFRSRAKCKGACPFVSIVSFATGAVMVWQATKQSEKTSLQYSFAEANP
jgi:hypothetical protein